MARATMECGADVLVTDGAKKLEGADRIILPGVGTFPQAMEILIKSGWIELLTRSVVREAVPFLGICLGMQLLAETGLKGTPTAGLGWIRGTVKPLKSGGSERLPHMG